MAGNWRTRVTAERDALAVNLEALTVKLGEVRDDQAAANDEHAGKSKIIQRQVELLRKQAGFMRDYLDILDARLDVDD